jgi:hypothetical protein
MERGDGSRCSNTASGSADTIIAQHGRIVGAGALAARGAHFGEQLKRLFVVAAGDVTISSKAHGGEDRRCGSQQQPLSDGQRFPRVASSSQHIPGRHSYFEHKYDG